VNVGLVRANVRLELSCGVSPVRWMRVRERRDGGGFGLVHEVVDSVVVAGPAVRDTSERQ
jgi:hypothetical protein